MVPGIRRLVLVGGFLVLACDLAIATASEAGGKEMDQYWADLASDDAKLAFVAIGKMTALPKETVKFLDTKLQPVPAIDAVVINKLVADLDSSSFAARQKATTELQKLGLLARPTLEKMMEKPPSAESRSRAKQLLDKLDGPVLSTDELRVIRAVEVLERVGTSEAKELLGRLTKGAPGARLTVKASDSLARLKK